MKNLSKKLKDELSGLRDTLIFIFPKGKSEILLFIFLLVLYGSYSLLIALQTNISDLHVYANDLYFSYDNVPIYFYGYQNLVGHPLMGIIFKPFMFIGEILHDLFGYKGKTVFLILISTTLISLSNVYIFRYLKEVLEIKKLHLYLITLLYAFFTTNLILCFTPETFTISSFLLTLCISFYTLYIIRGKKISFLSNLLLTVALGGVTITNFAKGLIPILFENEKKSLILKKILLLGGIFGLILLFCNYYYDDSMLSFQKDITKRLTKFTVAKDDFDPLVQIFDSFIGSPILMADMEYTQFIKDNIKYTPITFASFHYWQYAFSVVLLVICIVSIIFNYKNKYVWMLVLIWSVSIVIHLVIGYGSSEGYYIYGAHWICVVPLLFGWLCKSLKGEKQRFAFSVIIIALTVILMVNNITHLYDFIQLTLKFYSVNDVLILE